MTLLSKMKKWTGIKCLFLTLLLLFSLPVGAGATEYFLDAQGTAANKEAASGPCGTAANCMTIAVRNGEGDVYSADDIFTYCDDGGVFRDQLDIQSSGTSGHPIIHRAATGDTPIISGADIIETGGDDWTAGAAQDEGSDRYWEDAETGDLNAKWTSSTVDTNSALTWDAAVKYAGNNSIKVNVVFNDGNELCYLRAANLGDVDDAQSFGTQAIQEDFWITFRFRYDIGTAHDSLAAWWHNRILEIGQYGSVHYSAWLATSSRDVIALNLDPDGSLFYTVNKTQADTGYDITEDNWELIEVHIEMPDATTNGSTITVFVDGDQKATASFTGMFSNVERIDLGALGWIDSAGADMTLYYDNLRMSTFRSATGTPYSAAVGWDAPSSDREMVVMSDGTPLFMTYYSLGGLHNDNNGSFWWDDTGNTMHVILNDESDPDTTVMEVGRRDYCINGASKNYITIDGLTLQNACGALVYPNQGTNWIIQNCTLTNSGRRGIHLDDPGTQVNHNITVDNNTISYIAWANIRGTGGGIYADKTAYWTITDNTFHHIGEHGIRIDGAPASGSNITIARNTFYTLGSTGVTAPSYPDWVIEQNEIYDAALYDIKAGIEANGTVRYNLIHDCWGYAGLRAKSAGAFNSNIFWDNHGFDIAEEGADSDDINIYNNTFYSKINDETGGTVGYSIGLYNAGASGWDIKNNIGRYLRITTQSPTVDHNDWYRPGAVDVIDANGTKYGNTNAFATWVAIPHAGEINADPLFTNAGADDFTLQDGSPCINVGADLDSPYNVALGEDSTWPDGVETVEQGVGGADIGAFAKGKTYYIDNVLPGTCSDGDTDYDPTGDGGNGACGSGSYQINDEFIDIRASIIGGDSIEFREGTYQHSGAGTYVIRWDGGSSGGTDGNPVTLKPYNNETVILDPAWTGDHPTSRGISLSGVSYAVIDDFEITGFWDAGIDIGGNSSNIEIKNCVIHDVASGETGKGIGIGYSTQVNIHNNTIYNLGEATSEGTESDAVGVGAGSSKIRIVDNVIHDGPGHHALNVNSGSSTNLISEVVIRGNTIYEDGDYIGVQASYDGLSSSIRWMDFVLWEDNTFYEAGASVGDCRDSGGNRLGVGGHGCIFRYNKVYNLDGYGVIIYPLAHEYTNDTYANTIYHNTFYNNRDIEPFDGDRVNNCVICIEETDYSLSPYPPHDCRALNNIIDSSGGNYLLLAKHPTHSNLVGISFENNLLYNRQASAANEDIYRYETEKSVSNANADWAEFTGNIEAPPVFKSTNPVSDDFLKLDSGSNAIDAGTWLAEITAVNGNVLTVNAYEEYAFYDGWGIIGETADTAYCSDGTNSSLITDVGYDDAEITLTDATGFSVGEYITTINYSGTAPDIGRDEYGGEPENHAPYVTEYSPSGNVTIYNDVADTITANCTVVDDESDTISYLWTLPNSDKDASALEDPGTVTFTCGAYPCSHSCSLKVTDEHGLYNTYSFTITHAEFSPTVNNYTGSGVLMELPLTADLLDDASSYDYTDQGTITFVASRAEFDGASDYATRVGNAADWALVANDAFTICGRFNADTSTATMSIYQKGDNGTNDAQFALAYDATSHLLFYIGFDNGDQWETVDTSDDAFTDTNDCSFCVSFDDSDKGWKMRLYDNSAPASIGNYSGTATNNINYGEAGTHYLGADNVPGAYFDGEIWDLIKIDAEWTNDQMDAYLTNQFPLAIIAEIIGISADATYGEGQDIIVATLFKRKTTGAAYVPIDVTWTDGGTDSTLTSVLDAGANLTSTHTYPASTVAGSVHYWTGTVSAGQGEADLDISAFNIEQGTFTYGSPAINCDVILPSAPDNLATNADIVIDTTGPTLDDLYLCDCTSPYAKIAGATTYSSGSFCRRIDLSEVAQFKGGPLGDISPIIDGDYADPTGTVIVGLDGVLDYIVFQFSPIAGSRGTGVSETNADLPHGSTDIVDLSSAENSISSWTYPADSGGALTLAYPKLSTDPFVITSLGTGDYLSPQAFFDATFAVDDDYIDLSEETYLENVTLDGGGSSGSLATMQNGTIEGIFDQNGQGYWKFISIIFDGTYTFDGAGTQFKRCKFR